ncbi:MAG: hypothetical protein MJ245_02705 [Clostridia bacterium]|nr:hypothetical protein [Clostridia bacterium]
MSKMDDLIFRKQLLESELNLDYSSSAFKDEIDGNSTYTLLKYLQALELKDLQDNVRNFEYAENLIARLEGIEYDHLSREEKELLGLKEQIEGEKAQVEIDIVDKTKIYECKGEFSKIIWQPNCTLFNEEFLSKHKADLEGIIEPDTETAQRLQKENYEFFSDIKDNSMDGLDGNVDNPENINNDTGNDLQAVEAKTIQRVNEGYEPVGVIEYEIPEEEIEEDSIISNEEESNEYNTATLEEVESLRLQLEEKRQGRELTEEEIELNEEINNCIEYGYLDQARDLLLAEINEQSIEEENATSEEVEAESDRITEELLEDLRENGSIISLEDEEEYDADGEFSL